MKFIVDECVGPKVAKWLEEKGYEVFSVYSKCRGEKDEKLIQKAIREDWIILTNDKDFGEMIFRKSFEHRGVLFLRLEDESAQNKIKVLDSFFQNYISHYSKDFVVLTEKQIRFSKKDPH